jgi:hypothetical protein
MFGPFYFTFNQRNICLAMSATALQKLFLLSYVEKKVVFDCFYINFNRPTVEDVFKFLIFTLLKNVF